MLDYLIQFYKENDKIPTKTDLENYHTYPSNTIYRKRFGNWSNALILVEFDVGQERNCENLPTES